MISWTFSNLFLCIQMPLLENAGWNQNTPKDSDRKFQEESLRVPFDSPTEGLDVTVVRIESRKLNEFLVTPLFKNALDLVLSDLENKVLYQIPLRRRN